MKVSLVVMNSGKAQGQVIPVPLAQFVIGRDAQCNLRPGSALISKRHCAILVRGGDVFVRDFDSTNGTLINDIALKGEAAVKNDDVLKVGPLTFKIAIEGVAAPKTPTPAPPIPQPAAAPPTPAKKPTPPPRGSDDEDAAALLLGLDEEGDFGSTQDASSVPDGSTVMDMPINLPTSSEAPTVKIAPPGTADPAKPAAKKEEKKIEVGTAQAAAKAILEKWNKRSSR